MNKQLEEAIKFLKLHSEFNSKIDNLTFIKITREDFFKTKQSIETVLKELERLQEENREIRKKIEEIETRNYNDFTNQQDESIEYKI